MPIDARNQVEYGVAGLLVPQWQQNERVVSTNLKRENAFVTVTGLSAQLYDRRVYAFLEAGLSVIGADFFVQGELQFLRSGRVISTLPMSIAKDSAGRIKQSMTTICSGLDQGAGNVVKVGLRDQFTQGAFQAYLSPYELTIEADSAQFNLLDFSLTSVWPASVTAVRAFIGIFSHRRP